MARKKVAGAASDAMGASIERTRSKERSARRMEYHPMCGRRWVISRLGLAGKEPRMNTNGQEGGRGRSLTAEFADDADDADEVITLSVTFKRVVICSFDVSSFVKGINVRFNLKFICNDL